MTDITRIIERLKDEEGSVTLNGMHIPYKDHLGNLTIGYGTLIEPSKGGISEQAAQYMLTERILENLEVLQEKLPFWDNLSPNRQLALQDMAYQMGIRGLFNFKKMLAAIELGNWSRAKLECLDSNYAKKHTPVRAKRNAQLIEHG